jgi:hypothetical protein
MENITKNKNGRNKHLKRALIGALSLLIIFAQIRGDYYETLSDYISTKIIKNKKLFLLRELLKIVNHPGLAFLMF